MRSNVLLCNGTGTNSFARAARIVMLGGMVAAALARPNSASAIFDLGQPMPIDTGGGTILVVEENSASPHYYSFKLSINKKIQSMKIGYYAQTQIVIITHSDGTIIGIPDSDFGKFSGPPPAAGKAAPLPTRVSNDADTFDVACDGKTAVVAGANSATPVALVDLSLQKEIATAPYPGKLARAIAIDDAASTALVVLDNTTITNASAIRRLTISPVGGLVDTGEQLFFGSDYVTKVQIAPGAKTGVAIVGVGTSRLVSFALPGLVLKGSVALAGGTGNSIAFSPAGDRVYVRSGRRAITPDVIEGFAFDTNTGAIGQTATLRINNVSGFTGTAFQNPMALSTDATVLIAAEENADGSLPAPRVARYSVTTGGLVGTPVTGGLTQPQNVSTVRACASSPSAAQMVVEYYHAAFDHYFVTGIANEITLLDNGTLAGWARTGDRFNVYPSGTTGSPTCRFFSESFAPKSSHFYTPFAAECTTVKSNPRWQFEAEVFNMALPAADGSCTTGTVPLYRVYNNGQSGAPNHRYTTRLDVRAQMMGRSWIPEGLGDGVIGCVPPGPTSAVR